MSWCANWVAEGRSIPLIPDGLFAPTAVVEGQDGKIYIGDQGNRRLVRIDDMSAANPVALKGAALGIGELSAIDVRIPSNGRIYLAGSGSGRVDRINDPSGAGYTTFGSGQFSSAFGIFVVPR